MKRLFRIFFAILIIVGAVSLVEFLYFGLLGSKSNPHHAADTIFILNGASERIKKGYELAKESNADFVIISPADDSMIKDYEKQYEPLKAKYILENKARTTFENAYFVSKIISANRFRSVTFVTSDYHMPRSYLLLKLMLMGKGVTVQRLAAKSPYLAGSAWPRSEKALKVTYNEMVKVWGSLGELLVYVIRRQLPERNPKDVPFFRAIRSWVLFGV
ncbi:MAG TPA: YdcF family protein [Desulfobacterales bacterium]|nr:YdcF family protein [Desulfobacterales bacterium]